MRSKIRSSRGKKEAWFFGRKRNSLRRTDASSSFSPFCDTKIRGATGCGKRPELFAVASHPLHGPSGSSGPFAASPYPDGVQAHGPPKYRVAVINYQFTRSRPRRLNLSQAPSLFSVRISCGVNQPRTRWCRATRRSARCRPSKTRQRGCGEGRFALSFLRVQLLPMQRRMVVSPSDI